MKYKNSLSSSERSDGILHLIENSRHITVEMICREFHISAATARRDLDYLSKQSSIKRVHGGAIALHKSLPENPVIQRMNIQTENKRLIGIAAAEMIEPGDTLFLGSGTTVLEIAKNIKLIDDITVITNSLLVLNELIESRNITLVDPGGLVRRSEHSMIGDLTESTLDGLNADKVFIGIHGIDLEQGLTNRYLPETMTDRKILQMGKKIIIVADHTKCGLISTSHVAPIAVISTLVTDEDAPGEFVENLRDLGINVVLAGHN